MLIRKLAEAGLDGVSVRSAGTADYHIGSRPHHESIDEGELRGYEFRSVAAQFTVDDFDAADLILVMDGSNEAHVLALARDAEDEAKVVRMGAFASDAAEVVKDVPDPWGHPREAYVAMYDQLEEAIDGLVAAIAEGRVQDVVESVHAAR